MTWKDKPKPFVMWEWKIIFGYKNYHTGRYGFKNFYFDIWGHSKTTYRIWPFYEPPPCSDSFYTLSMDKNRHFWPPLPTPHLVHLLSYWMAPYYTLSVNVGITTLAKYIRTIFIFWPILETRTEILQILSFAFWEIWRQDKLPLKLTDL